MTIRRVKDEIKQCWTLVGDPGPSDSGTGPIRYSVSQHQLHVLQMLGMGLDCLEVGTGCGVSTEALATSARRVATFDVDDSVVSLVVPHLPSHVRFFDRRTNPLQMAGAGFELVFLDGLHDTKSVIRDIRECFPLMRPDALWIFHDTQMMSVHQAVLQGPVWFKIEARYEDHGPTMMWVCTVDPNNEYRV